MVFTRSAARLRPTLACLHPNCPYFQNSNGLCSEHATGAVTKRRAHVLRLPTPFRLQGGAYERMFFGLLRGARTQTPEIILQAHRDLIPNKLLRAEAVNRFLAKNQVSEDAEAAFAQVCLDPWKLNVTKVVQCYWCNFGEEPAFRCEYLEVLKRGLEGRMSTLNAMASTTS